MTFCIVIVHDHSLKVGVVAKAAGVGVQTLHCYESWQKRKSINAAAKECKA